MARYALLLTVLIVTGCTTVSNQPQAPNAAGAERALVDENFLVISGNYQRLIALYKEQLKQNDQSETRIKLAKAYLDTGDNESALFTLVPVITMPNASAEAFYLQGLAQFNLGQAEHAERSLAIAANKEPNNAKVINLLGAAQAELGQLVEARAAFDQARTLLYDDVVIKNNLALVDMMEGKYQDAAARLMPLYRADPKGADAQLKANLAIVAAKLGSFETLRALYGSEYSESELFGIFQGLRSSAYVPSISLDHSTSNKLLGKADASGDISWKKSRAVESKPPLDNTIPSSPIKAVTKSAPPVSSTEMYLDEGASNIRETLPDIAHGASTSVANDTASQKTLPSAKKDGLAAPQAINTNSSESIVPVSNKENRQTFKDLVGIKRRYSKGQPINLEEAEEVSSKSPSYYEPSVDLFEEASKQDRTTIEQTPQADVKWPMPASTWKPVPPKASAVKPTASEAVDLDPKPPELQTFQENNSESIKTKKNWHFVALEQYSLLSKDGLNIPVAQFRHSGQLIDLKQNQ